MNKETANSTSELLVTLTTRVVLPCLPIFIERLVALMIPSHNLGFPNRDVLVVAFLVPIVWIVEIRSKLILLLASIFILLAAVPFICSLLSPSPRIYAAGLILAMAAVVLFSALEISAFYKNKISPRDPGRSDI